MNYTLHEPVRKQNKNFYAPDEAADSLIEPYGGKLVNLLAAAEEKDELTAFANSLFSIQLSERAVCDLELLATGAFSPLESFMNRIDYERVLNEMRLSDNRIFPVPVMLAVESAANLQIGKAVALRNSQNNLLAILDIEEIYEWDANELARKVFGTTDALHPLVAEMNFWGRFNLSGKLRVLNLPGHADFRDLRLAPTEVRRKLKKISVDGRVVAFQTRNPLHRAHEEMTKRAMDETGGALLLHPVVGTTKVGDVDYFTRVRTYRALVRRYYDENRAMLALTPLAMRFAGPREAVWHAIVRRNYGADHFIVGRNHANPGADSNGKPFYAPDAAQKLAAQFSEEIGVKILSYDEFVYLPGEKRFEEVTKIPGGALCRSISGTEAREKYLNKGKLLPKWFSRPETARILAESCLPKYRQGFCLWFTGLSGAGKSTTAEIIAVLLSEVGRKVTLLDGDVVRTHLSKGLGFGKEDRDTNVRRIGFVAAEIVRHGGAAICAAVSPYRAARSEVRNMIGDNQFVEIFVATPLEVCERRDAKGIYEKARRGAIKNLTGIDDPYEPPVNPEITLDTVNFSAEENARRILDLLVRQGFVRRENVFRDAF
ncbi:MAG TPA: bifunctional sulfate adenylyltransferase/adenylylsulfate kinase [Pyrinomonadaceae bacterium]|jgi:sulfate adenylyltransferase